MARKPQIEKTKAPQAAPSTPDPAELRPEPKPNTEPPPAATVSPVVSLYWKNDEFGKTRLHEVHANGYQCMVPVK